MEVIDDKENQPPESAVKSLQDELPVPTVRYASAQDQPTQILHFGESARSLFMLEKPSEERMRLVIALKDAPRSVSAWLELLRCPLTGNPTRYSKLRLLRRALTCVDSEKARQTAGYTEMCIMLAKLSDSETGIRQSFCDMKSRRVGEKQPLLYEEEAAFEYAAGNEDIAEDILERGVDNDALTPIEKEELLKKVIAGRAGWVAAFSGSQQEQKRLALKTRLQTLRQAQNEIVSAVTSPRVTTTPVRPSTVSAGSTPVSREHCGGENDSSRLAMTPLKATPGSYAQKDVGFSTVSKAKKSPLLTTPSLPTRSVLKSHSTTRKTQHPPLRFQLAGPPLRVIAGNENQSDDDDDDNALIGSQATPTKPQEDVASVEKQENKAIRVISGSNKRLKINVGDINHILKWNPKEKILKKEESQSLSSSGDFVKFPIDTLAKPVASGTTLKSPATNIDKAIATICKKSNTEVDVFSKVREVSPVSLCTPMINNKEFVTEKCSPRVHRPFPWELKASAARIEPQGRLTSNVSFDHYRSPNREQSHSSVVGPDDAESISPDSLSSSSSPPVATMSSVLTRDALESLTSKVVVNGQKYIKLEQIGSGGSSKVYRMLGPDLKIYALKKIKLKKLDDKSIAQFTNEIELLKRLQGNPYIIKLIAAEQNLQQRQINVIMEHGEIDLSERLKDLKGGMDENMLRVIWTQMLEAVNAIHQKRIIHGDLKPANFLFVNGVLKLIDFGIAKTISNDTTNIERDSQIGTVNFMSPEAIQGNSGPNGQRYTQGKMKVGRASDIWSLGCILYQIVHSKPPFGDIHNIIEKFRCIIDPTVPINFPSLQNKHLEDVIRSCLQRDHRLRPPIVGENGLLQHPFLRSDSLNTAVGTPIAVTVANAPQILSQFGEFLRCQGVAASRVNMFIAIGQDGLRNADNEESRTPYYSYNTQERRTDI
ncbi:putative protein kinase domain, mad3/Bub1 region 1, protein kinase Mps1 family [Plasmopara halstedii]